MKYSYILRPSHAIWETDMAEMEVRVERLETMRTAYTHAFSEAPEEDAWRKMKAWARPKGLLEEGSGARIFGRNTYPTDNSEPHGYELFFTIGSDVEPVGDIGISEIQGGLYAALKFKNLENIRIAWEQLWKWIEKSDYEHAGWRKGEHGWVDGFEELLTPHEKPQKEWILDLWVRLKE